MQALSWATMSWHTHTHAPMPRRLQEFGACFVPGHGTVVVGGVASQSEAPSAAHRGKEFAHASVETDESDSDEDLSGDDAIERRIASWRPVHRCPAHLRPAGGAADVATQDHRTDKASLCSDGAWRELAAMPDRRSGLRCCVIRAQSAPDPIERSTASGLRVLALGGLT